MKKVILSIIITLLIGACQINNHERDKRAISNWILGYQKAIRDADIEKLLSYVSNNIVYLPPNVPAFSGKENLRKWFLEYFNYYTPSEKLIIRNLRFDGDLAYLFCNYATFVKENHSGKEFNDDGKIINIFQRQPNGEWKIIYSIWNSNRQIIDLHSQILADFSGTWNLDLSRSTAIPNLLASKIFIVQKGNDITVNQTIVMQDKEPIQSTFKYTIGTKNENVTKTTTSKVISSWSSDKHSFTVIREHHSDIRQTTLDYKRTTTYSITAEGETLNIISDDILPEGVFTATNDRHMEMIFNREVE